MENPKDREWNLLELPETSYPQFLCVASPSGCLCLSSCSRNSQKFLCSRNRSKFLPYEERPSHSQWEHCSGTPHGQPYEWMEALMRCEHDEEAGTQKKLKANHEDSTRLASLLKQAAVGPSDNAASDNVYSSSRQDWRLRKRWICTTQHYRSAKMIVLLSSERALVFSWWDTTKVLNRTSGVWFSPQRRLNVSFRHRLMIRRTVLLFFTVGFATRNLGNSWQQ